MKRVVLFLAAVALGGCETHQAVLKNDHAIAIRYDPMIGVGPAMREAEAHCASYGKSAVPTTQGRAGMGSMLQNFECR